MFIETVPNRNSPPAVLLRESFRDEHGKAQKRTVANLSKLPAFLIAGLKGLLKGGVVLGEGGEGLSIERSLPHGHVAAALGTIRKLALDRLMLSTAKDDASMRHRDLVVGLIVDRLVTPRSKLGFVRAINEETANSSIGALLDLGKVAEREVYEALDWLLAQQERVENGLARRHLKGGALVLYDVSSSYLEGRHCPLARYGYSRDHRGDRPQIVYGLLCTREGLPVAVEVFEGNTADPTTLTPQIVKLKKRFGLERVVVVGDRGMLTSARIREDVKPGRARLDLLPAQQRRAGSGERRRPLADVLVRRARSGRDQRARSLSGRAVDRLPQPLPGRRAGPQAPGAAGGDGTRLRPSPPSSARWRASFRGRRNRPGGGRGDQQAQGGQALRADHHRRHLELAAPHREHRARSAPRRGLRRSHQPDLRDHERQ